jgi:hypothetical protein
VADDHDVLVGGLLPQLLTASGALRRARAFSSGWGVAAVGAPRVPHLGRDLVERKSVVLAVVEFDPALVDDERRVDPAGRLACPRQWARHHPRHRAEGLGDESGLLLAEFVERRVEMAEQQSAGVGRRSTVTYEHQHARS